LAKNKAERREMLSMYLVAIQSCVAKLEPCSGNTPIPF
jgi:hypothetical protein